MPIREKRIKWDEENEDKRFRNVDGFKYDIISQSFVCEYEEMPKHFLAETQEEAEKLYKDFAYILNGFAYSYSTVTNIDKYDLFGEALIGLGRASRDFDSSRSDDFKTFAIFKIKSAIVEYIRKNISSIIVPAYIKQANNNIQQIKTLLSITTLDAADAAVMTEKQREKYDKLTGFLNNIAVRAGITMEELTKRSEFLPTDTVLEEAEAVENSEDDMNRKLVVAKLLSLMSDDEKSIAQGIMEGKTYTEIGEEHGKTDGWVKFKLNEFKKRAGLDIGDL